MAVDRDGGVNVDLLFAHLRPQALLQTALLPYTESPSLRPAGPAVNGPYVPGGEADGETAYLLNPRYFALTASQPREIVERRFADGAAAAAALRRGDVQVWDRVNLWQVKALRADANLVVRAYELPRVHCLIPNARKPLTANRTFRRALAYGINCRAILEQLLRGDALPGCTVLHGPFPVNVSPKDAVGYASDAEIAPWPYDPRLAISLAEAARREAAAAKGTDDRACFPPSWCSPIRRTKSPAPRVR